MNERAGAWLDASLRHRLWFSEIDDHDTASLPFGLFRRGDMAAARNVCCGSIGGREVRAFDLAILERQEGSMLPTGPDRLLVELAIDAFADDQDGGVVTERWTCALVRAGAECWRLAVSPEGLSSTLADLAILPDQDFELEGFNRAFEVRSDDRKFANDFLDARMIEFLVEAAIGSTLEAVGNRILVARPASDLPDVDGVLALALGVAERVPNVVRDLYPALPVGELTPRCPLGPDGIAREMPQVQAMTSDLDPWHEPPRGWV